MDEQETPMAMVKLAVKQLRPFFPKRQLDFVTSAVRGEEGEFFKSKLVEMANVTLAMPKTYEQDGLGMDAVAHLHYFCFDGSGDWWITEKDMEPEQHQAFGLADLWGDGGEIGYIAISELIESRHVEIDLYFKPQTLRELRRPQVA